MQLIKERESLATIDIKARLSTLWIFILFNMLFRDIHEFARPGFIDELINSNVSEMVLLQAGFLLELLIGMVLLSRLLPYRLNRWANMIVPIIAIVAIVAAGFNDLDDILFGTFEIGAALLIIWMAWQWREEGPKEE